MRTLGIVALLSLVGCRERVGLPDAGADAPPPAVDAWTCPPFAPSVEHPYGTSVGRTMRPMELETCDGSGTFRLYDHDAVTCEPGDHHATLVLFATVWCVPSQREAEGLDEVITEVYGPRGLRVVEILMDGPTSGGGLTEADCEGWDARFDLDVILAMDSGGVQSNLYIPDGTFPESILIDADGVIRYIQEGSATESAELIAQLEALLPP